MSLIAVVLVMISAGSASALQSSPRSLLAAAPSDIPPGCTSAGLQLQSDCEEEISGAGQYFGVQGKSAADLKGITFDAAKVDAYLATAGTPSPKCCKASCNFNNNYCSCSQGVLDVIKSFTPDLGVYYSTATFFGTKCMSGTTFLQGTCPADLKTAMVKPNNCAA